MEKNIKKNMEKMARLIQTLEERIPKSDNVAQGTHENNDSVHIQQPSLISIYQEDFLLIVEIIMDGFQGYPLSQYQY